MYLIYLFLILLNFQIIKCLDKERITFFNSDITVNSDASMDITETIKVFSAGKFIKRGITREFPTIYFDKLNNKYIVSFKILDVLKDNIKEDYHVEDAYNGKRIFIGSKDSFLKPGNYSYTIKYHTDRQLGFFKDHDELFFNVTGQGSKFQIDYASATVTLPINIPLNKIQATGYTGYFNSVEQNFKYQILPNNKIFFYTTKPLYRSQGLTIAISWPKGYIKEPDWQTKIKWFLTDNIVYIWIIFWSFLITLYYMVVYQKRKGPQKGIIIPLFDAPLIPLVSGASEQLTPGQVRYIYKMKYDSKVFASEIVNLAVNGYIKIDYNLKTYTLIKDNIPDKNSKYYDLYKMLFKFRDSLKINAENSLVIGHAQEKIKADLYNLKLKYFEFNSEFIALGILLSCLLFLPLLSGVLEYSTLSIGLAIFSLGIINIYFMYSLANYTNDGRKIMDEIEGFRMFLNATEKERLKFTNFPDKTPELYEEFLPYAIALDVEENWSKQFAPIFDALAYKGQEYVPKWYVSKNVMYYWYINQHSMNGFSSALGSSLSQSISSSISSSMSIPGKNSGFGNQGGGAGRGGGGGGIGGW